MTGWTPLFQKIVGSSIWDEPDHIRIAWVTMLAITGKDGVCQVTAAGLARFAKITVEQAQEALDVLAAPDKASLSQDEKEGRRIERVDGGWKLINWEKFRELAKSASQREANAKHQAAFRERQIDTSSPWHVAHGLELPEPLRTAGCLGAVKVWLTHKAERNEAYKPTGLKVALLKWAGEFTPEELSLAIRESISNNWKGVFRAKAADSREQEYTGPNLG
jgi:hypothetical protein